MTEILADKTLYFQFRQFCDFQDATLSFLFWEEASEYVNIEDAIFQSAFIASVEAKVIAGQTVETEERLVKAAEHIAQQVVEGAEGQAAAILAIAIAQADANDKLDASLTNDVLLWQRINRWNGILPATLLSAGYDSLDVLIEIPAG